MPPSTNEAFDPETWSVATGPVPVPVPPAEPRTDPEPEADSHRIEITELRHRLGQVSTQLERTHHELLSARNQLGAARARTVELEHHLHTRIVEVTELRNQVQALTREQQAMVSGPGPMVRPPVPPGAGPAR